MDQPTPTSITNFPATPGREDVLCHLPTQEFLEFVNSYPKPLEQIGFTGIVLPDGVEGNTGSIQKLGLSVHRESDIDTGLLLESFSSDAGSSAVDIWTQIQEEPLNSWGVELTENQPRHEVTTLLHMSTSPIPIVPVSEALLYASSHREQRELLRSAVFWRKRYEIARHIPKLVHAGGDGLLIYTVDSWLVSINQNPDEASIDLGSHGSMWLMLGTQRDVHLHGSMLILPAFSGAVVANELAR